MVFDLEKFKVDKKVVFINLEDTGKIEVLKKMADRLCKEGYVKESYIQGILKREKIFPTGLQAEGCGVAIPHTDVEHVNSPMIAVATLKNTVEFNMMGGERDDKVDVKIIFMLAMKDGNAQLALLQKLMEIIQDRELLEKICREDEIDSLVSLINSVFTSKN